MALGALLGASGAEKKKLGAALGRLGAKKRPKMGPKRTLCTPLFEVPSWGPKLDPFSETPGLDLKPLGLDFGASWDRLLAFLKPSFQKRDVQKHPSIFKALQEHFRSSNDIQICCR